MTEENDETLAIARELLEKMLVDINVAGITHVTLDDLRMDGRKITFDLVSHTDHGERILKDLDAMKTNKEKQSCPTGAKTN